MPWSSETDGWIIAFSFPEQLVDPDVGFDNTKAQLLREHGQRLFKQLQKLIPESITIESHQLFGAFVIGPETDCLKLKKKVEAQQIGSMGKTVRGSVFSGAGATHSDDYIAVQVIIRERSDNTIGWRHAESQTGMSILIPEANNMLVWTDAKDNVFLKENFVPNENCIELGTGRLPKHFVATVRKFMHYRDTLRTLIRDALPRDVNEAD